jgi:hypothetical protein
MHKHPVVAETSERERMSEEKGPDPRPLTRPSSDRFLAGEYRKSRCTTDTADEVELQRRS